MIISVNNELKDLGYLIEKDCNIKILLQKMRKVLILLDMILPIY